MGDMSTQSSWGIVPTTDEFGARLALIRHYMGWNQKEAAIATGLPQASWREWELSGRAPRNIVQVADKISQRTGISGYWILTGRADIPGGNGGEGLTQPFHRIQNRHGLATITRVSDSLRRPIYPSYRDGLPQLAA